MKEEPRLILFFKGCSGDELFNNTDTQPRIWRKLDFADAHHTAMSKSESLVDLWVSLLHYQLLNGQCQLGCFHNLKLNECKTNSSKYLPSQLLFQLQWGFIILSFTPFQMLVFFPHSNWLTWNFFTLSFLIHSLFSVSLSSSSFGPRLVK